MASNIYEENSDNDDLIFVEATASRKRKSITLLDDNEEDDDYLLDKQFNSITNKPDLTTNNNNNNKKQDSVKLLAHEQILSDRIDRLCEYTHVLMHCLLFKINYYNKKTHFEKYLKYNTIVYVIYL
jgi:hypothetical protein